MLGAFKNLAKDQQYKMINDYMKEIETECIELRELVNQDSNTQSYEYQKNIIERVNALPLTIDMTVNLIEISKLSENFKNLLIEELNKKIQLVKRGRTR